MVKTWLQSVLQLGSGASLRRQSWWKDVRSPEHDLQWDIGTLTSSPVCFLVTMRWAALLGHMLPATMYWLTTGLKWWGRMTVSWNFWSESRKFYLSMRGWMSDVCLSDTGLINTKNWYWEAWALAVCVRNQWNWFVEEFGEVKWSRLEKV